MNLSLEDYELLFKSEISKVVVDDDPAQLEVVVPAAWLHDYVIVAKNNPRRNEASRMSVTRNGDFY